ncbi:MAG: translation initiation factor IF-2 N-terminal domain-containing protein, partial [Acidimicrobiia bacterium]
MAKQRVYELARDLGLESKDVLARAQELGIEVKTASSGLDEDAAALVRLSYEETAADSPEQPSPDPELEVEAAVEVSVEPDTEPETDEEPGP